MEIEIEAILHGGAIDLGHQPACARQAISIDTRADAERQELIRCFAGMLAASAADMEPKLIVHRSKPAFESPMTLVVIPDECQSMPMTAPND